MFSVIILSNIKNINFEFLKLLNSSKIIIVTINYYLDNSKFKYTNRIINLKNDINVNDILLQLNNFNFDTSVFQFSNYIFKKEDILYLDDTNVDTLNNQNFRNINGIRDGIFKRDKILLNFIFTTSINELKLIDVYNKFKYYLGISYSDKFHFIKLDNNIMEFYILDYNYCVDKNTFYVNFFKDFFLKLSLEVKIEIKKPINVSCSNNEYELIIPSYGLCNQIFTINNCINKNIDFYLEKSSLCNILPIEEYFDVKPTFKKDKNYKSIGLTFVLNKDIKNLPKLKEKYYNLYSFSNYKLCLHLRINEDFLQFLKHSEDYNCSNISKNIDKYLIEMCKKYNCAKNECIIIADDYNELIRLKKQNYIVNVSENENIEFIIKNKNIYILKDILAGIHSLNFDSYFKKSTFGEYINLSRRNK